MIIPDTGSALSSILYRAQPGFDKAFENRGAAPAGASTLEGLTAPGPGQWHQSTRRALKLSGRALRPGGSAGAVEPWAQRCALQAETRTCVVLDFMTSSARCIAAMQLQEKFLNRAACGNDDEDGR